MLEFARKVASSGKIRAFLRFIQCCKSNQPTCADFKYAAAITEFLLLGHLAIKAGVGQKVEWDPQQLSCHNHPELTQYIKRVHRQGWEV